VSAEFLLLMDHLFKTYLPLCLRTDTKEGLNKPTYVKGIFNFLKKFLKFFSDTRNRWHERRLKSTRQQIWSIWTKTSTK